MRRTIYLVRHGQSEYNVTDKLGGDSKLTSAGAEFARRLDVFMENESLRGYHFYEDSPVNNNSNNSNSNSNNSSSNGVATDSKRRRTSATSASAAGSAAAAAAAAAAGKGMYTS
jgi:hypothetical protein